MTKFNEDRHGNVVRNLRDGYLARYGSDLMLGDEAVFQIWDENCLVECDDDPEDCLLPVYEALKEADGP